MKFYLPIFTLLFSLFGVSQNNVIVEKYRNGNVKLEKILHAGKNQIIKMYYKNGQLKNIQYLTKGIVEEYYKNGQLSYRKIQNQELMLEEAYSKEGALIIRLVDNNIEFSSYDNALNDLRGSRPKQEQDNTHNHSHNHGHNHDHGHNHHH